MFYATQIKSIDTGGVIDTQGKRLTFIGYLPVKVGDTVYTDGNVIFGNAPPKGSTQIFDVPKGIPVLGNSSEFRGYIKSSGNYKPYRIEGNEWIVNGKKTYYHDNGEENIIDAEIALDDEGEEIGFYTVEKKIIGANNIVYNQIAGNLVYKYYYDGWFEYSVKKYYSILNLSEQNRGIYTSKTVHSSWWGDAIRRYPPYVDFSKVSTPTIVDVQYNGGTAEEFISNMFPNGGNNNKTIICDSMLIIRRDNTVIQEIKLSNFLEYVEKELRNLVKIDFNHTEETKEYIKSHACLLNFKIQSDGKWVALISAELCLEQAWIRPGKTFFWEDILKLEALGYSSSLGHASFLFKVDSESNFELLAKRTQIMPLWYPESLHETYTHTEIQPLDVDFSWKIPKTERNTFPYISYATIKQSLTTPGFNQGDKKILEITYNATRIWDSSIIHPNYDKVKVDHVDNFTFPVQDDYQAKFKIYEDNSTDDLEKIKHWRLKNIYDRNGIVIVEGNELPTEIYTEENNAHAWNMSLAPLKNGEYLFGIHKNTDYGIDGKLYKISRNGDFKQVGDGLKNFRLRELKNISKAKR